ncbi:MAG: rod shape-determining protein RodA [Gammaproteobacteria bacterium]|nr:rod shape-determining protein RodA [Gammaproteobacteria bacterium]
MNGKKGFSIDWALLTGLLALSVTSLFVVYSAGDQNPDLLMRQSIRIVLAFTVMFLVARITPDQFLRWTPYLYGIGLIMLLVVLGAGVIGKGAQRWIDLGFMRFQPAEMMKLAVPMMVAWVMVRKPLPASLPTVILGFVVLVIPVILVIKQPDLGTAILIAASGLVVIFFAGMSWWIIAVLAALVAAAAPLGWFLIHDYQRQRILTLFDPWSDPLGAGYHTIQSAIAVGSGGLYGKGWLNGSQSQLDFIPERSTDFIFAVFSEEFGFMGSMILLLVYLFVVSRSLYIAIEAKDSYTRLLCGSLAVTFAIYVFVNIGMVTGILPIVGVPLPLISYGGTSMVSLLAGFGILMSAYSNRWFIR